MGDTQNGGYMKWGIPKIENIQTGDIKMEYNQNGDYTKGRINKMEDKKLVNIKNGGYT